MYENILIPTDGSESSIEAAKQAISLAKTYDATLHTIHVVDIESMWLETYEGSLIDTLEAAGEEAVASVRDRTAEADIETMSEVITDGKPARGILDYVDENDIDLIVMGTHGRRGIERYLLGSVTERVVRLADVPVLTVPPSEEES